MRIVKYMQEGGMAPEMDPAMAQGAPMGPETAPAPEQGGEDPIMMIAQAAMQALQSQDCEMAMQVCDAFIQLIQGAQGAPAEAGAEPQGEPMFRKGGKLVGRK